MFRIERSLDGHNWETMMCSPHRVSVDDLRGPPEDSHHQFPSSISAGNKSAFTGKPGWFCRVRFEDTAIEQFVWDKIPLNEFDPESDTIWGWKLVAQYHQAIPAEKLYPLSFIG